MTGDGRNTGGQGIFEKGVGLRFISLLEKMFVILSALDGIEFG